MNELIYDMSVSEITNAKNMYTSGYEESFINQNRVSSILDEYVSSSSSSLEGIVWDAERMNMDSFNNVLLEAQSVDEFVKQSNIEVFDLLLNYLDGEDINTYDLPTFEAERDSLVSEIQHLTEENKSLNDVPPTITKCIGKNQLGIDLFAEVENPEYFKAQRKINENLDRINNILQPELNEKKRLIEKINYYYDVILPKCSKIIEDTDSKVNSFYQKVNDLYTVDHNVIDTLFVGTTSVASGILKAFENLGDGLLYVSCVLCCSFYDGLSEVTRFVGGNLDFTNSIADYLQSLSKSCDMTCAEWTSCESVEVANDLFYNETDFGKNINDGSYLKYDSEVAQTIQNTVEVGTTAAAEIAVGAATAGSPYYGRIVSGGIGALNSLGKQVEENVNSGDNMTVFQNNDEMLSAALTGVSSGVAASRVGASNISLNNIGSDTRNGISNIISSYRDNTLLDKAINGVDNAINESARNVDNAIHAGASIYSKYVSNELTANSAVQDVVNEYGIDIVEAVVNYVSPTIANIADFFDNLADSRLLQDIFPADAA